VAHDLRKFTCDAIAGQEIYASPVAVRQAKQKIKNCQIAFTTCIGAGLGLLRAQRFDIVIIDEASQQTEPASLVPLVKGCSKAILVGDHVQLRPTVQQIALTMDFDVSLFERLYTSDATGIGQAEESKMPESSVGFMSRLMLDTQYRMHKAICEFSSDEFYDGKLRTGITPESRPLFDSAFPWPIADSPVSPASHLTNTEKARTVFIECTAREDFKGKSKSNQGQVTLCVEVCKLLCTVAAGPQGVGEQKTQPEGGKRSIGVLTPYAKQVELLKRLLSGLSHQVEVSSIDGFQGREADIIILVTVRCNEHHEIGFLRDLRRLNVALTRARSGLVVIGNRATLTTEGETSDPESSATWKRLLEGFRPVVIETSKNPTG
jgi:regulator of nonsense transcripts 1